MKIKKGDRVFILKGIGKGEEAIVEDEGRYVLVVKLLKPKKRVKYRYLWKEEKEYEEAKNPSRR